MTTMELIEKYGIGFNCLSDAYDLGVKQGRADVIEELDHKIFNDAFIMANMPHEVYVRLINLMYSLKEQTNE